MSQPHISHMPISLPTSSPWLRTSAIHSCSQNLTLLCFPLLPTFCPTHQRPLHFENRHTPVQPLPLRSSMHPSQHPRIPEQALSLSDTKKQHACDLQTILPQMPVYTTSAKIFSRLHSKPCTVCRHTTPHATTSRRPLLRALAIP